MTDNLNKPSNEKRADMPDPGSGTRSETRFYIEIAACGVLAALGAYIFVPFRGPVASIPLIVVCAAAAAALRIDWRIKVAFFALFGLFFHTVETQDITRTLIFAAVCAAICSLCCLSEYLVIKAKKPSGKLLSLIPALAAIAAVWFIAGNPFSAFNAGAHLTEYAEKTYSSDDFQTSACFYDYTDGTYGINIGAYDDPNGLIYRITFEGGTVKDKYLNHAKQLISEISRLNFLNALRSEYPNENYYVSVTDISRFSADRILLSDDSEKYSGRETFVISIPSDITLEEFFNRAEKYLRTLQAAGLDAAAVRFRGGVRGEYFYGAECPVTFLPINKTPVFDITERLSGSFDMLK